MRYLPGILFSGLTSLFVLISSCNEPTILGEELLQDDRSEIFFTDDLPVKARTIPADSVVTYNPLAVPLTYFCGNYLDPIMGKTQARVFAQLGLSSLFPEFVSADSLRLREVELALAVDTFSTYGNDEQLFRLEVSRLGEALDPDVAYYANQSFAKGNSITKFEFLPEWQDSLTPQIRVPLPLSLGEELLSLDSVIFTSNELFQEAFPGLVLEATKNTGYLLAFNLNSALSGLRVSYTRFEDTLSFDESYLFSFAGNNARMVNFSHDYEETSVEKALELSSPSDTVSSLFVQGMAGVNIEVELSDLEQLQGAIINKAELICYSIFPNQNVYPLISRLFLYKQNGSSLLQPIRDVSLAQATNIDFFGGTFELDPDLGVYLYKFNLSAHLQDMIDGVEGTTFVISPGGKAQTAGRTLLFGPGSTSFPIELKVTYTKRN